MHEAFCGYSVYVYETYARLTDNFAGIRMHFIRSLACMVGVFLYLAEVTYQDYRSDKQPLELSNMTFSEQLVRQ